MKKKATTKRKLAPLKDADYHARCIKHLVQPLRRAQAELVAAQDKVNAIERAITEHKR